MRPDRCWMCVSMLVLMVLHLNADGEKEPECATVIRVQRYTVHEVAPGDELRMECAVTFCGVGTPNVSWEKYPSTPISINGRTSIERKRSKPFEWISYLIFKKIHRNDSGEFQCQMKGEKSHLITVRVSDEFKKNSTENTDSEPREGLYLYLYLAAGIAALVAVTVAVSVVAMRGCKGEALRRKIRASETRRAITAAAHVAGESRGGDKMESQYMTIPMAEQRRAPRRQASPRGSPSVPPCRRSVQRKVLGREMERERGLNTVKDQPTDTSLVYAALNHPLPPRGGARPPRPAEAPSEYAAIRVA